MKTVAAIFAVCGSLILLTGCGKETPPAKSPGSDALQANSTSKSNAAPWFEEIAGSAGLSFHHHSGHDTRFYMPEMMSGGVGLLDYDGDGLLDVFCVDGGAIDPAASKTSGCRLYHNLGGWRFEDVTDRAGVAGHGEYGMGCVCGDYDGDGRVDIFVTLLTGGILYHNNGDGTFTDMTRQAGITGKSWGTSGAFLDFDGDGNLDLFVANYLKWSRETELNCFSQGGRPDYCSPMNYKAPAMDTLYHNNGDGTFRDVTAAAGLDKAYGNGLGVACADFNRDGLIDIFVANDAMPNQLWINKGGGRFAEEALLRGCAVNIVGMPRAGMGVAASDLRQRGMLDLFVTHLVGEGNGLFVNTNGYFIDSVAPRGPNARSLPMTGFGVGFVDFDNDGYLDLYVANGRVKFGTRDLDPNDPYAEPNTLLRGLPTGEFDDVRPLGGTATPLLATSRGAAFGDLDNDGGIDIIVVNKDGPAHLLRNVVPNRGNWVAFRVLDRRGSDAINAAVRVEVGEKVSFRHVMPNQGYCSSNDPRVHFGLGDLRSIDRVVVRWPRGGEESFGPFAAGKIHTLREGQGQLVQAVFGY